MKLLKICVCAGGTMIFPVVLTILEICALNLTVKLPNQLVTPDTLRTDSVVTLLKINIIYFLQTPKTL